MNWNIIKNSEEKSKVIEKKSGKHTLIFREFYVNKTLISLQYDIVHHISHSAIIFHHKFNI